MNAPTSSYRVLIVEDDEGVAALLRAVLAPIYVCERVADLRAANRYLQEQTGARAPDVVILDWMLPDGNGIDWLAQLRRAAATRALAVLMLTARGTEADKVMGLEKGADDYLIKPFSPKELVARVQALLRRRYPDQHVNLLVWHELRLDNATATVTVADQPLALGPMEFRLLRFFLSHPDKVFTREQLLDQVWGYQAALEPRTVDVNVSRLRRALAVSSITVEAVRSLGYALRQKK